MADDALLVAYLQRRDDLIRYFRVRLRSEAEAQDIVQEIYLRILEHRAEDVGNPAAYLYRVGTNLMLDRIKQRRRTGLRETDWRRVQTRTIGGEDVADEVSAEEVVAARQRLSKVVEAIGSLPPPVQQAFRLHKLEGLSHAETAAAMGVSRSSVEKYLMAALKAVMRKVGA